MPKYVSGQNEGTGNAVSEPRPVRRKRTGPEITEANLLKIVTEQQNFFSKQDTAIQHVRDVVERTNDVGVSKEYQTTGYQVRDGTVTDHVLGTGTMLTVNRPKLQLTYPGKGGESKAKQDLKARLEPAIEALVLDDAGHNGETYGRVGMSLAQDGAAWSLVTRQSDRWESVLKIRRSSFKDDDGYDPLSDGSDDEDAPKKPRSREYKYSQAMDKAKRRAGCLIDWTYLDPKCCYPVWVGERDLGCLIVVTEHPRWTTLSEYGLSLNGKGDIVEDTLGQPMPESSPDNTAPETVKKVAHWTANSVTYYLTCNSSVRKIETIDHNYGFIPVAYSFGWRLPHWSNIKAGWGSAAIIAPAVEYVSHLKTLHANQTAGSIAPPYQRTVPQGGDVVKDEEGNPVLTQQIMPNTIYNLRPGEKIEPFQQAKENDHLTTQIQMEMQQIVDLRGPVATGNLSDADNGFAIESVKSDRKVKNSPFIQGCQDHLEQVTDMALKLLRDDKTRKVSPFYVKPRADKNAGLMTISVDDLEDEPSIVWDISPEQPAGAMVEARGYHERMQAGTLGPEAAIERMGDNPSEVFEDILRGKMREDPLWVEMAKAEMVSEYGRGDLYARFVALQQWAATGAVGPGGQPGQAGNPAFGGMGNGAVVGDQAAMAMSPGGAGAQPITPAQAGIGPPVEGAPARVGVPQQAAAAQIQSLG